MCWRPAKDGAELYNKAKDEPTPLPDHTPILHDEPLDPVKVNALRLELLNGIYNEIEASGKYFTKKQIEIELQKRVRRFGVYLHNNHKCPTSTVCHSAMDKDHNKHILCLKKAPNDVPAMDEWYEPYGLFKGFRKVDVKDIARKVMSQTANNIPGVSIKRKWFIDREFQEASLSLVLYNPNDNKPIFPDVGGVVTFQDANKNWIDLSVTLFTHNKGCTLLNIFTEECPSISVFHIKAGTYFQYT